MTSTTSTTPAKAAPRRADSFALAARHLGRGPPAQPDGALAVPAHVGECVLLEEARVVLFRQPLLPAERHAVVRVPEKSMVVANGVVLRAYGPPRLQC